jgi:hypothetical protein
MASVTLDPDLHRVLAEQIPRKGRLGQVGILKREAFSLFRAFLESHGEEIRAVDLDLAAFVCVTSIEAVTHIAESAQPGFAALRHVSPHSET